MNAVSPIVPACASDEHRKTVGVVTLPGSCNYGNRLQCYAVCAIYKKLSCYPTVLTRKTSDAKKLAKRLLGREWRSPEELMNPERASRFLAFNKLIDQREVSPPHIALRNQYDLFSVGSDQTWNPKYMSRDAPWYFLRFARKRQRIALSPSIGLDNLEKAESKMIRKGVEGFARLSVREERGARLIKECSGQDARVICDPTLVLEADEWRSIAKDDLTPEKPYVFAYLLGEARSVPAEVLNYVTEEGKNPVVLLSDNDRDGEVPAGPAEFISLIDNAKHVITDSFHAAVFAAIMQTPLIIVQRERGANIFSRLETLSHMLGIEHKIYSSPCFDLLRENDYEGVPEAISRERKNFIDYLETCLNA